MSLDSLDAREMLEFLDMMFKRSTLYVMLFRHGLTVGKLRGERR